VETDFKNIKPVEEKNVLTLVRQGNGHGIYKVRYAGPKDNLNGKWHKGR